MEVGGKREISPVPFSLSLSLSARRKRHTLSRFLRSSVPLSSRFIRCIGRAWGVTNPSRIRIAAPTVGIRRAIGPNDTRKPNGKRKYDPDFRSVKRIRETRSRRTAPGFACSSPRALYPPPRQRGEPSFFSFHTVSSLSLPLLPFTATPVHSRIPMVETRRLVARQGPRFHWTTSVFLLPQESGKRSFADFACLLAERKEGKEKGGFVIRIRAYTCSIRVSLNGRSGQVSK